MPNQLCHWSGLKMGLLSGQIRPDGGGNLARGGSIGTGIGTDPVFCLSGSVGGKSSWGLLMTQVSEGGELQGLLCDVSTLPTILMASPLCTPLQWPSLPVRKGNQSKQWVPTVPS